MNTPTKKPALEMRQGRGTQTLEIIAKIRIIGEVFYRYKPQPGATKSSVTRRNAI
jgi:hypothetical protein